MKEYEVSIAVTGYYICKVNAENEGDALDLAEVKFAEASLGSLEYCDGVADHIMVDGQIKYLR